MICEKKSVRNTAVHTQSMTVSTLLVFYQYYPTAQQKQSFTTKLYISNKAWQFRPKQKNLQHISNSRFVGVVKSKAHINVPKTSKTQELSGPFFAHILPMEVHTHTQNLKDLCWQLLSFLRNSSFWEHPTPDSAPFYWQFWLQNVPRND